MQIVCHVDLTDWCNTELIHFHFHMIAFSFFPAVMMENDSQMSDKDIYIKAKSNAPESLTAFANFPSADNWTFVMFLVQLYTVRCNNIPNKSYLKYLCRVHHHPCSCLRQKSTLLWFPCLFLSPLWSGRRVSFSRFEDFKGNQANKVSSISCWADQKCPNRPWPFKWSVEPVWITTRFSCWREWQEHRKRGERNTWIKWVSLYYKLAYLSKPTSKWLHILLLGYLFIKACGCFSLLIPRRASPLLWLLLVSATTPNSSLDIEDYKGHSMID